MCADRLVCMWLLCAVACVLAGECAGSVEEREGGRTWMMKLITHVGFAGYS